MPPSLLLAAALCASPGPPLRAQEPPVHPAPGKDSPGQAMDDQLAALLATPVQVSSSKATGVLRTPSTVSILDRETIRRFNLQTIEEALTFVTGVEALRTHQKRSIITVRGILQDNYTSKVLILIDGVPAWMTVTGEGTPVRIDPEDVERIEVLRGPASVLYGSNAYVGAVNIVLRRPATEEVAAHAGWLSRGGSLSGARLNTLLPGDGRLMVALNQSDREASPRPFKDEGAVVAGQRQAPTTAPFQDYDRVRHVTLSLSWGPHRLLANLFRGDEGFLGNIPVFPAADYPGDGIGNNQSTAGRLLNYTFEVPLGAMTQLRAGLTHDWQDRDFSRVADNSLRSDVEGVRTSAFLRLSTALTPILDAEAGMDWERRKAIRYNRHDTRSGAVLQDFILPDTALVERSVFVQGRLETGPFHVTAGSRYTRNDQAGGNLSSRMTAVWQVDETQSLKCIVGQSFRAPTFFELYFAASTIHGNPDLRPEKAATAELAYVKALRNVFLQATLYRSRYEGKIARVADPLPGFPGHKRYANGGTFNATGLELEARFSLAGVLDAFLNADALLKTDRGDEDLRTEPGHYNFRYAPRSHASAGISRQFGYAFASLAGRWTGPMDRPEHVLVQDANDTWLLGPSQPIGSQFSLDATLGLRQYVHGLKLVHTLSLKNATNRSLLLPDYVRRNGLASVPSDDLGRQASYTLRIVF